LGAIAAGPNVKIEGQPEIEEVRYFYPDEKYPYEYLVLDDKYEDP